MQLEVGRSYKTVGGDIVKIVRRIGGPEHYHVFVSDNKLIFTHDGFPHNARCEDRIDVEYVPESSSLEKKFFETYHKLKSLGNHLGFDVKVSF